MSTALRLGRTLITLTDHEFGNGFQVGYLHFKKDFQGKRLTNSSLIKRVSTKHVYVLLNRSDKACSRTYNHFTSKGIVVRATIDPSLSIQIKGFESR